MEILSRQVKAYEVHELDSDAFRRAFEKYCRKLDRETEEDGIDREHLKNDSAFLAEAKRLDWRYRRNGNYI